MLPPLFLRGSRRNVRLRLLQIFTRVDVPRHGCIDRHENDFGGMSIEDLPPTTIAANILQLTEQLAGE